MMDIDTWGSKILWPCLLMMLFGLISCNPVSKTSISDNFSPGINLSYLNSTLTASSSTVAAQETLTLRLTLRDDNNSLFVSDSVSVSLYTSGGTSSGTISALQYNHDGTYTASFRGVTAGTATSVFALVNGQVLKSRSPQVIVTPGFYSLQNSELALSSTQIASGSTATATLTVKDDLGNQLTSGGLNVAFLSSGGVSSVSFGTVTDHNDGTYSVLITGLTGGSPTLIQAKISGNLVSDSPSLTVIGGVPSSISTVSGGSQTGVVGSALSLPYVVVVKDSSNNVLSGVIVDWAVVTNNGSLSIASSSTNASGNASATLTLGTVTGVNTVSATIRGTAISVSFNSTGNPSSVNQLVFSSTPSSSGNTDTILAVLPVVSALDAYGNIVTSYTQQVSLSAFSGTNCTGSVAGGVFATTNPVSATAGVISFSGVKILKTSVQSISASDGSRTVCHGPLTIAPGAVSSLVFTTQPSSVSTAGAPFATQPVVTLYDANSNVVTNSTSAVSLSLSSGSGTLSGTSTVTSVNGVATFSNLAVNLSGAKILTATVGSITRTSNTFTINSGSAASLVFTQSPSTTGNTDSALSTQPVIEARDGAGNVVSGYNNTLSFTAYSDSSCSTVVNSALTGETVMAVNGVATWANLKVLKTTVIALRATDGSTSSSCLSGRNISPGAVSSITFTAQPSSTTVAGVPIASAPVVTLYDANLNIASQSSDLVSISLSTGTGVLSGTKTIAAINGVATFTNLSVDLTGTNKVLTATVGGISASSNAFTITPGAVSFSQSILSTSVATVSSGSSVLVTLTAKDSYGNANPTGISTVSFDSTSVGGTGSFGTVSDVGAGVYTTSFSGAYAGAVTLSGVVNGTTITSSSSISVTHGPVAQLVFSITPSTTGNTDTALSVSPVVSAVDSVGNVVASYVSSLSISGYSDSSCTSAVSNSVSSTNNPLTAVSGVASFLNFKILKTNVQSISASDGMRSVCFGTLSISPGTPISIIVSSGNNQTSSHGTALSSPLAVIIKDSNNNLVSSAVVNWTVTSGDGSLGATSSTTNASGLASVTFTTGVTPGTNTITATINGTSSAVSFSAVGSTSVFSFNWGFDVGSSSSYVFNSSRVEYTSGLARLLGTDQTDDDNSSQGFSGGTSNGVSWDSASSYLRLTQSGTPTNLSELDSSWTPSYSSLVQYWKLNGSVGLITDGTVVPKTIGANGTGKSANGTGLSYVTGKLAQGISFDGVDDNVDFGSPTNLNFGTTISFTVSFWVNWTNCASTNRRMFSTGSSGSSNGLLFYCNGAGSNPGQIALTVGAGGVTANAINLLTSATNFNNGQWHHVLLSVNQTTRRASLYVNGNLLPLVNGGCGTLTSSYLDYSGGTCAVNANSSGKTTIGSHVGAASFFNGLIDEFAIWNTALTASDVQLIYSRQSAKYSGQINSRVLDALSTGQSWTSLAWTTTIPFMKELSDSTCTPTPCTHNNNETASDYSLMVGSTGTIGDNNLMSGILGLWHFDEASGQTTLVDNSGQGKNGTAANGVVLGLFGRLNGAASFDGVNDAVVLANGNTFFTSSSTAGTLSAWVYGYSPTTDGRIIAFKNAGGSAFGICAGRTAGTASVFFRNGATLIQLDSPAGTFTNGVWYHIVATAREGLGILYMNGVEVARTTSVTAAFTLGDMAATNATIGAQDSAGSLSFKGLIDEVGIWSRALDPKEVMQLYRRSSNRLKYQVRVCTNSDCSDDSTEANWKGPDGTNLSYFSELYNMSTQSATPGGTVKANSPLMTFSNFTSPVGTSRYFQYRSILESDDPGTGCNYGAGATWCSPELKAVSVAPIHYDSSSPTIHSIGGVNFWDLSSFSQTLGTNGCSGGIGYNLSLDKSSWYYWNGSAWAMANGTVTQSSSASAVSTNAASFGTSVGRGTVYFKAFLKSSGSLPCEIDSVDVSGVQ